MGCWRVSLGSGCSSQRPESDCVRCELVKPAWWMKLRRGLTAALGIERDGSLDGEVPEPLHQLPQTSIKFSRRVLTARERIVPVPQTMHLQCQRCLTVG